MPDLPRLAGRRLDVGRGVLRVSERLPRRTRSQTGPLPGTDRWRAPMALRDGGWIARDWQRHIRHDGDRHIQSRVRVVVVGMGERGLSGGRAGCLAENSGLARYY